VIFFKKRHIEIKTAYSGEETRIASVLDVKILRKTAFFEHFVQISEELGFSTQRVLLKAGIDERGTVCAPSRKRQSREKFMKAAFSRTR